VETVNDKVMNIRDFRYNLYLLFPDITTHKRILTGGGDVDVLKFVEITGFDPNANGKRANYNDFYEYLEENQHLYNWWML